MFVNFTWSFQCTQKARILSSNAKINFKIQIETRTDRVCSRMTIIFTLPHYGTARKLQRRSDLHMQIDAIDAAHLTSLTTIRVALS